MLLCMGMREDSQLRHFFLSMALALLVAAGVLLLVFLPVIWLQKIWGNTHLTARADAPAYSGGEGGGFEGGGGGEGPEGCQGDSCGL
jgi:uncharacterized membrane protein YgcG